MEKNTDRMYIVVREKVAKEDLGHAMLAIAHAVGAAFRDWANDFEFDAWANDSFRKCLCLANEKEWQKLKALGVEFKEFGSPVKDQGLEMIVMTESALDGEETAIVFKPRVEWPKIMRSLRLLNIKSLRLCDLERIQWPKTELKSPWL